ncbi:hypothetical protein C0992_003699 [Termitomyces sp. T32_za158]|nr:hypothetical protein C0992_003699 [Termitomyces sp. T32_za158]
MKDAVKSGKTSLAALIHESTVALIGDTLDFQALGLYNLHGSTLNPRRIIDSINADGVYYHVWAAVKHTLDERNSRGIPRGRLLKASMERFLSELADVILPRVDGPHFTFVDPRKHDDMISMIRNARRLISLFEEKNIPKSKVVVSIPATLNGIRAAQVLEREHEIHTNLYLVSGLLHAAACAEAAATTITVPVGRLFDWYERRRRTNFTELSVHPGTEAIQALTCYFKLHRIKTRVIGSEFRSLPEIVPLTGLDAICISKDQADGLKGCQICVSTSSAGPSPVALLRARQALYPTELLSAHSGFMDAMSTETRAMITAILYDSLSELRYHMDELEALIARELAEQYQLRTLDLKSLYQVWNGHPHRMRKGGKDELCLPGDREIEKVLPPKRSLEKGLRLEEKQWTADDVHNIDDVF